jgi:hypothetical protein
MSGGRITLAIYIAIGFIPVVFGPAAVGQSSTHYKTWPEALRQVEQSGTSPPGWSPAPIMTAPTIVPPNPFLRPIVIRFGQGGRIDEHKLRFGGYQRAKAKVEVRGPCYSACTLLLAYIEPGNLCIAEGGFMAFHAIRSIEHGEIMVGATHEYYASLPPVIRMWIDDNGGWHNLPLNGYWTMRDMQLWARGYPKCQ